MTATPLLSICIVNWNTKEDLAKALASLPEGHVADREVIVVDNASSDGSPAMVRSRFPAVKLLQNAENVGFSRAYNRALQEATGRYLLVLNPDCVIHPGALSRLIEFMESNPEAGAVGPRLLNADGTLQFSCRRFPTFAAGLFRNTPLGRIFPGNRYSRQYLMMEWDHSLPQEVDWISGAAMLIRRPTLEEVGPLDEGFFMYCEDVDWCYRARQKGWKIYYLPTAVITHLIGRSSDQRPRAMVVEFHRSMRRFYRKHYAAHWPAGFRWLPLLAIKLRLGATLLHYHLLKKNKT
jgi:hypothetical protein